MSESRFTLIKELVVDAFDCTDPIIYEKDWGSDSPSDSLKTLHRVLGKISALAAEGRAGEILQEANKKSLHPYLPECTGPIMCSCTDGKATLEKP